MLVQPCRIWQRFVRLKFFYDLSRTMCDCLAVASRSKSTWLYVIFAVVCSVERHARKTPIKISNFIFQGPGASARILTVIAHPRRKESFFSSHFLTRSETRWLDTSQGVGYWWCAQVDEFLWNLRRYFSSYLSVSTKFDRLRFLPITWENFGTKKCVEKLSNKTSVVWTSMCLLAVWEVSFLFFAPVFSTSHLF